MGLKGVSQPALNASTIIRRVNAFGGAQNVTRSLISYGVGGSNGTDTQRTYRNAFVVPQYSYDIRAVFVNAGFTTGLVQTGTPGSGTGLVTIKAALEYNGGFVPMTFGGGNPTTTMPAGGMAVTDPCPTDLPAGATAYVRVTVNVASGDKWAFNQMGVSGGSNVGPNGSDFAYGVGTSLSVSGATNASPIVITTTTPHNLLTGSTVTVASVGGNTGANGTFAVTSITPTTFSLTGSTGTGAYTSGGTVTTLTTNQAGQNTFGHSMIMGSTWPLTSGSWYTGGDSIAAATGDAGLGLTGSYLFNAGLGFLVRGLEGTTGSLPGLPRCFLTTAVGGTTTAQRLAASTAPAMLAAMSCHDYALYAGGRNDITAGTVATIKANFLAYWNMLANRGMKVYQCTVLPATASTDNWRSTTNQSIAAGINVIGATNASPIVITSGSSHFLTTGQTVKISGVGGNTAANGTFVVTVTDGTHFSLNGTTGNGSYTSGGLVGTYDSNRVIINDWIRSLPAPLSGVVEIADLVEANASNVPTRNGGYWYCPETSPDVSGTSSGSNSSTTLNDTSKSWTTNQWEGYMCCITGGTGAGQALQIASNTATAITTYAGTWSPTPDATSTYVIQKCYTIDGTHPTTFGHIAMSAPVAVLAAQLTGNNF